MVDLIRPPSERLDKEASVSDLAVTPHLVNSAFAEDVTFTSSHFERESSHDHGNAHTVKHSLGWVDRFGAVLGTLCAVHCAMTPIAITLLPLTGLGALWTSQGELCLLGLASLLSAPSIWSTVRLMKRSVTHTQDLKLSLWIFGLSWIFLILSLGLHHDLFGHEVAHQHGAHLHHAASHLEHNAHSGLSIILSTMGGIGLAIAHYTSLKARRNEALRCGEAEKCLH